MPTGYTIAIKNGISFKTFIMNCARAMGACVTMRDEPHDKEIPNEFKVPDYHIKQLSALNNDLLMLNNLDAIKAEKEAKKEYHKRKKDAAICIQGKKDLEMKYIIKLAEARSWTPPSSDHNALKDFMISQINNSIAFDCDIKYIDKPKLLSGNDWLKQKIDKTKKDLAYHTSELHKEKDRVNSRNTWIKQLRESLT